jgi:hypothetical protein
MSDGTPVTPSERFAAIRRAQVWMPTDIGSLDLKAGPTVAERFAPGETVSCDYVARLRAGHTPTFWCAIAPDDVEKVRYQERNGEVYGMVAATRLFWALGFGADRDYPTPIVCRGCPRDPWKSDAVAAEPHVVFDPATIDRRMPGRKLETAPASLLRSGCFKQLLKGRTLDGRAVRHSLEQSPADA